MSTPVWPFTENQFLNATEGSYKKMFIISADTDSKLFGEQSDPLISPLFLFFNPHKSSYMLKFTGWKSKEAAYKGKTTTFYQLLADLSGTKIENFDVRIQVVYPRGTGQYEALLPDFRAPFQTGEIEMRIGALLTLAESIGADAALLAVKTDVLAFHTLLINTRNEQQALEGQVSTASNQLELERVKCAQAMYYVLGGLMQVFNDNTSHIAHFFDLETLRGHVADVVDLIFTGPVNTGGQVVNVLNLGILQYIPGVKLRIKNTSTIPAVGQLFFYAANNAGDGWGGIGHQLNPGDEVIFDLLPIDFKPFYNVQNQSPTPQTFEVEIILP